MLPLHQTLMLRALVVAAALMAGGCLAFGQDEHSANIWLPGCRGYISDDAVTNASDAYKQGQCSGAIGALVATDPDICPPEGAEVQQAARIAVQYIDSQPARLHENFLGLARDALRAAWPCR